MLAACSRAPAPKAPPATPPSRLRGAVAEATDDTVVIDAGLDCVHARVRCELAACRAELHNECASPIVCGLDVIATCDAAPLPLAVEATARESVPVDSATTLEATADCGARSVIGARIGNLHCR